MEVIGTLETRFGPLLIARAAPADLDDVYGIICDAARWLQSRGISQWGALLTTEGREVIRARMDQETYVLLQDGFPVATLYIRWEDPLPWGQTGLDGQAGYVHGFAVRRCVGGHGVGAALLAWAADLIAARGRPLIRLDTSDDNPAICAYYERLGFVSRGVSHGTGWHLRLFERQAVSGLSSSPRT